MKTKDIFIGKIDAHNEFQEYGPKLYKNCFLQYERYSIDSFLEGSKYFICGNKGTGKTALLKYLECILSENDNNLVIPIRFKTQFDKEDKKTLMHTASNIKEEVVEDLNLQDTNDCILIWQVFIINKIIQAIDSKNFTVFSENKELKALKSLLSSIYSSYPNKLMPKLLKGYAKANINLLNGIDAELGIELEFNKDTSNINFTKAAKAILSLFKSLTYSMNRIYVIFDELELSVQTKKDNDRDIKLVRDLILAVERLNGICKGREYNIRIITSIRNEVVNSVLASGYEINKSIEDFGVNVSWYQKGGDYKENPLIKLIENKIIASENQNGITNNENVWERYFPQMINETEVRKYILSYSWYRPRDIVRMLGLVQLYSYDSDKFTQEMFDRAMQDYSEKSWNEIVEELRLTYSDMDIKAIKKIFTNIQVPFTYGYLARRIDKLKEIYDYVKSFSEKYKLIDLLEKMFDWGIIGNSGQRMVFKFLGDRDLAPTEDMIIHKPLRNFFAVQSRQNYDEQDCVDEISYQE